MSGDMWKWFPILFAVLSDVSICDGVRRGPHHPRSEVSTTKKVDQHLTHEEHRIEDDLQNLGLEFNPDDLTEEEKHFYHFKVHDNDRNNALDGLEMLQAAIHQDPDPEEKIDSENYLKNATDELNHIIEVIDEFLLIADTNKDGLLQFPEYVKAVTEGKEVEQNTV